MAWGSSTPASPPPPRSTFSKLLPLLILLVVGGGFAFVAYQVYLVVNQVGDAAEKKMKSKNVVFTKDGMKVGVKEMRNEKYVDKTQSIFVKAWNLSSWPGYKSKLWNKDAEVNTRKPYSRTSSSK